MAMNTGRCTYDTSTHIRSTQAKDMVRHTAGARTCSPCTTDMGKQGELYLCRYLHTGIGYWTTRGYANSRIANSRTRRLADWTTRGLDNSRTRQLAYWTSRGCHQRLCVLSFLFFAASARLRVVQSATCPVHELTSARVV